MLLRFTGLGAPMTLCLGLLLTSAPVAVQGQDDAACTARAATLSAAKQAYAQACAPIPRRDCDPVGNGWTCSSVALGNAAPGGAVPVRTPASTPAPAPVRAPVVATPRSVNDTPDPAPPVVLLEPSASSECVANAASLSAAKSAYEASCMAPRVDCDPIPTGWSCSSGVIGAASSGTAPAVANADRSPPPTASAGNRPTPRRSWADSYSVDGVCYIDTTFDHGIGNRTIDTPVGRLTIRQAVERGVIERGPGIVRAQALYNDIQCGNGPPNDAGDEDRDQCPGRVDRGRAGCTVIGPRWSFSG